jgi:FAD/FMN-containing dehydrogenase
VVSTATRGFAAAARQRHSAFKSLDDADAAAFRDIVGAANVIDTADELAPYNEDWLGKYKGSASMALKPGSSAELSAIMRRCHEHSIAVVPQGGNTGLVGGSVPVFDEVVVNTSRMNDIISFDEASGILVCEAGCVLEGLDNWLAERGFMMPLDLGAKGLCEFVSTWYNHQPPVEKSS